jgi:type I restriction enzyme S subunit
LVGEWPKVSLSELVEIAVGGLWGSETRTDKEDTPVRVVRGVDAHKMSQRHAVDLPIRWVSAKQLASRTLCVGDVVLEASGACGRSYVIRDSDVEGKPIPISFSNFSRRLIPNERVEPDYLGYRLKQAFESGEIASYVTGTAMPNLDVHSALAGITIHLPPLHKQREIAGILGALDDKIELNRQMNSTREAMARALFKSWFVDFDPVRAKAEGRKPVGMDAATAAVFPDSFIGSVLGPIPKGWTVQKISEVTKVGIGRTPPRLERHWFSHRSNDVPWMSIRDLGSETIFIKKTAEFLTDEAVARFRIPRIPQSTVVLSFKLTLGRVAITASAMLSNEAIAHFIIGKNDVDLSAGFLYFYLKCFEYDQLGNTSSIATAINSEIVRGIPLLLPTKSEMTEFNAYADPILERVRLLEAETRVLEELRDTVLPRLLSGELRAGDAAA